MGKEDLLLNTAKERFGIDYLFPYQRLVMYNILEAAGIPGFAPPQQSGPPGREPLPGDTKPHQIIILPTGAGKSLCFMLPALFLKGPTLVIFPLLSLIADQARRVEETGMEGIILRGGQSREERRKLWRKLDQGKVHMILTNPETALSPGVLPELGKRSIQHLVIDEMHTVSEWGDTFRPVYREIGRLGEELKISIISAFTATASETIINRIKEILFPQSSPHLIAANPDRPNISYRVHRVLSKSSALASLLSEIDGLKAKKVRRPAIIFCRSRVSTELTAAMLRRRLEEGEIFFYHAGLEKDEKKRVEEWFFSSTNGILCATCAYGMGVDKKDIRTVIHRDIPPSVEAYLQESGRGGRDREPSEAVILLGDEDSPELIGFDTPVEKRRYQVLHEVFTSSSRCRREGLLAILGAEPEACFGCDVCDGVPAEEPPGEIEIIGTVASNKRRFTPRQIIHILMGKVPSDMVSCSPWLKKFFGSLHSWSYEEVMEGISSLLLRDGIKRVKRGWFKNTLTRK